MTSKLKDFSPKQFAIFLAILFICLYIENKLGYFDPDPVGPVARYGWIYTIIIFSIKAIIFICTFPFVLLNVIGTLFVDDTKSNLPVQVPNETICFRVVSRGFYSDLVKENLNKNLSVIKTFDALKYTYEVVTDNKIGIQAISNCFEVVVPEDYETKTGAKFKARALQYALEKNVSNLKDSDWIIHLDEETLLTKSSMKGILKFTYENKHPIGQGNLF